MDTPPDATFPIPDAELLARLRRRDPAAFRWCYDTFYNPLLRFAFGLLDSRESAQDAVQDAFYGLFTKSASLTLEGSLRAYLFGAVRNHALNMLRHDTVVRKAQGTVSRMQSESGVERPDTAVEHGEIDAAVRRALATLPERQRLAMMLRWEHNLSTAEIARVLGVSDVSAGHLLAKAAAHLRRLVARA